MSDWATAGLWMCFRLGFSSILNKKEKDEVSNILDLKMKHHFMLTNSIYTVEGITLVAAGLTETLNACGDGSAGLDKHQGGTTTVKQEPGDPLDIGPGLPHKGRTSTDMLLVLTGENT